MSKKGEELLVEENMRKATERGFNRIRRAGTKATVVVMFAVLFVSVLFGTLGINFAAKNTAAEVVDAWTTTNGESSDNFKAGTRAEEIMYNLEYQDRENGGKDAGHAAALGSVINDTVDSSGRVTAVGSGQGLHRIAEPGADGTLRWDSNRNFYWFGNSSQNSNRRCQIYYIPFKLSSAIWNAIQNGVSVHMRFSFLYSTWYRCDRAVSMISPSIQALTNLRHGGGGAWGYGSGDVVASATIRNIEQLIAFGQSVGGGEASWHTDYLGTDAVLTSSNVKNQTIYLAAYLLPYWAWDLRISAFFVTFWYGQTGSEAVNVTFNANNTGDSMGTLVQNPSSTLIDSNGVITNPNVTATTSTTHQFTKSDDTLTLAAMPSEGHHFVNWKQNFSYLPSGTANNAETTNPRSWNGTNVRPGTTWTANFGLNKMQIILHSNYGTNQTKTYWKDYGGNLYTLENGVKQDTGSQSLPKITSLWNRTGTPYEFGGWFATQVCSGSYAFSDGSNVGDSLNSNGITYNLASRYARGYSDITIHLYAKWAGPDFGTIASSIVTGGQSESSIDSALRLGNYSLNGQDLGLWGGVTNPFVIDGLDSFLKLAKIVNGESAPQDSVSGDRGDGINRTTAASDDVREGNYGGYLYDGCHFVISTNIDLNNERMNAIGKNDSYPFGGNLSGNYAFYIYLAENASTYLATDRKNPKVDMAQARKNFETEKDTYIERGFNTSETIENIHIITGTDIDGSVINATTDYKYTGLIGCYDSYEKTKAKLDASSITQARYITDIVILSGYVANNKKNNAIASSYDAVGGFIGCLRKGCLNIINCTVGDKENKDALHLTTSQTNWGWGRHVGGFIGIVGRQNTATSVTQGELHAILNMEDCESYATITCIGSGTWDTSAGGLIGSTYAKTDKGGTQFVPSYQITIKGCTSDGIISGFRGVGGIAGVLTTHSNNGGKITIQNCVSTAELQLQLNAEQIQIQSFYKFGGIVGDVTPFNADGYSSVPNDLRNFYATYNPGPITIEYVYSSSWISNYTNQNIQYVGGIVGAANFDKTNLTISHAYYDGNMGDGGGGSSLIDKYGNTNPTNTLNLSSSWAFLGRNLGVGAGISATTMTAPPNTNTLISSNYGKYIFYTSTVAVSAETILPAVRMLPLLKTTGAPTYFDSWDGILTNNVDGFYAFAEDMPYGYYMYSGNAATTKTYGQPYAVESELQNDTEAGTNKLNVKYGYNADVDTYNAWSVGLDLIGWDSATYPSGVVNQYFVYDGENHVENKISTPPTGQFYTSSLLDNDGNIVSEAIDSGIYNINASILIDEGQFTGNISGNEDSTKGMVGRLLVSIHIERRTLIVDDFIMSDGTRWKATATGDTSGEFITDPDAANGVTFKWQKQQSSSNTMWMKEGGNHSALFDPAVLSGTWTDVGDISEEIPVPVAEFIYNLDWQGVAAIGLLPNFDATATGETPRRLYIVPRREEHVYDDGTTVGYYFEIAETTGTMIDPESDADAYVEWLRQSLNYYTSDTEPMVEMDTNPENSPSIYGAGDYDWHFQLYFRQDKDTMESPIAGNYNYGIMFAGQTPLTNTLKPAEIVEVDPDDPMSHNDGRAEISFNINPINIEEANKRFVFGYGAAESDTPEGTVSLGVNDAITLSVVNSIRDTSGTDTTMHTLKYASTVNSYDPTNGIALIYMDGLTVGGVSEDAVFDKWESYKLYFSTQKEPTENEGTLYAGPYIDITQVSETMGQRLATTSINYIDGETLGGTAEDRPSTLDNAEVIRTLEQAAIDGYQTITVEIIITGNLNFAGSVTRYVVFMAGDFGRLADGEELPYGGSVDTSAQWGSDLNPYVLNHEAHLIRLSRIVNGEDAAWDSIRMQDGLDYAGETSTTVFENTSFATDNTYSAAQLYDSGNDPGGSFYELAIGEGYTMPASFLLTKDMSLTSGETVVGTAAAIDEEPGGDGGTASDDDPTEEPAGISAYGGFKPIGQYDENGVGHPFSGAIYGLYDYNGDSDMPVGHKIRYIIEAEETYATSGIGLFGYTKSAYIRGITALGNIAVKQETSEDEGDADTSATIEYKYVGGIVGYAQDTTLSMALSRVNINMPTADYVGGLFGYGDGVFYYVLEDNAGQWLNPIDDGREDVDKLYVYSDTVYEEAHILGGNYVGAIAGQWKVANMENVGVVFETEYGDQVAMFPTTYVSMGDPIVETEDGVGISMLGLLSVHTVRNITQYDPDTPENGSFEFNVEGINFVGGLVGLMDTTAMNDVEGVNMEIYPYIASSEDSNAPYRVAGVGYTGGLYGKFSGSGYKKESASMRDVDSRLVFSTAFDGDGGQGAYRQTYVEVEMKGKTDDLPENETSSVIGGLVGYAEGVGLLFDTQNNGKWEYNKYIKFEGFDATYTNDFVGGIVGVLGENATIEGLQQLDENGQPIAGSAATIERTRVTGTEETIKENVNGSFVGAIAGYVASSAGAYTSGGATQVAINVSLINTTIQTGNHFVGGIFGAIGKLQVDLKDRHDEYDIDADEALSNLLYYGTTTGTDSPNVVSIQPSSDMEGNGTAKLINMASVHGKVGGSQSTFDAATATYGDYVGGLFGYVGGNVTLRLVNPVLKSGLSNKLNESLNVFNGQADLNFNINNESDIEKNGVIIEGRNYVGGIAGYIAGTEHQIIRFVNRARIVGNGTAGTADDDSDEYNGSYIGGLAGYMDGGTISDSMAVPQIPAENITSRTDFIRGKSYTGGIVGALNSGAVTNCIVTGIGFHTISANTGGIAGTVTSGSVADSWTLFTVGDDGSAQDEGHENYPTYQSVCQNNYGKYVIIDSRVAQLPNLFSLSHMIGLVSVDAAHESGSHNHTGINDSYNPGQKGYLSFAAQVPTEATLPNKQLAFYNATGFNNAATHNFICLDGTGTDVYFKLAMSEKSLLVCVVNVSFKGFPTNSGDEAKNKEAIENAYKSPVREDDYYGIDNINPTWTSSDAGAALSHLEAAPIYRKGVKNGETVNPFVVGNYKSDITPGSEGSPYLITSQADWDNFAQQVRDGTNFDGQYVQLATDNVTVTKDNMAGATETYKNSSTSRFAGTFDGDGHYLTVNLTGTVGTGDDIDKHLGAFQGAGGYNGGKATFKNLTIKGNVSGGAQRITSNPNPPGYGAFVGAAAGDIDFFNCVNEAKVEGFVYVGGFIGCESDGSWTYTFTDCVNKGTIVNKSPVNGNGALNTFVATGGFVGRHWGGTSVFDSCLNEGTVIGAQAVGGLFGMKIGAGDAIRVYNSGNRGNVTAFSTYANYSKIDQKTGKSSTYNSSDVDGFLSYAAGLVAAADKVEIYASFNEGTITGYGSVVGGLYAGASGTDGAGLKTETGNNGYKYVSTTQESLNIFYSYNAGTVQAGGYGNNGAGWDVTEKWNSYNGTIVGGLVGFITGAGSSSNTETKARVRNCYNVGDVISWGTLSFKINNPDVTAKREAIAGGLVGAIYYDNNMNNYAGEGQSKVGTDVSYNYNWGDVKLMATVTGGTVSPSGDNNSYRPFIEMGGQIIGFIGYGKGKASLNSLTRTNNLQKKNGVYVGGGLTTRGGSGGTTGQTGAVIGSAQWADKNNDGANMGTTDQWTGVAIGGTTVNAEEITINMKYWFIVEPTNKTFVESTQTLSGTLTDTSYTTGVYNGWIYIRGCLPQLAVFALRTRDGLSMLAQDTGQTDEGEWETHQVGTREFVPYSITGPVDMQAMSQLINLGFEFDNSFISIDNDIDMNYMQYSDTLPVTADLQPAQTEQGDDDFLVGGYSFKQGGYNYYIFGKGALRSLQRSETTANVNPADNRADEWLAVEEYLQVNSDGATKRSEPWTTREAKKATDYQYIAGQQQPQTINKFVTYYPNNMMHNYASLDDKGTAIGMPVQGYGSFKGNITGAIKDVDGTVTGNHTISNMRVAWGGQIMPKITPYVFNANVGLFGSTSDATISYITLDDTCRFILGAETNNSQVAAGYIGGFVAHAEGDLSLIGVEMNSDLSGGIRTNGTSVDMIEANAGGLVGMYDSNADGKALTIVSSKVSGNIYGRENAGGFVGVVNGDVKGSTGIGSKEEENIFSGRIGTFGTYNTAVTYRPFGGIIGRMNEGSIYGFFTNKGSVNGGAASTDVGGVIGFAGEGTKIGVMHTISEFVNGVETTANTGEAMVAADVADSASLYGAGYIGGVIGRTLGAAEGDTYGRQGTTSGHKTALINYSTNITPNRENTADEYAVGGLIGFMGGGNTVGGMELHNFADLSITGATQTVHNVGGAIGYISFTTGGKFDESSPVFFDVRGNVTNTSLNGKNVGGVVGNLKSATKLEKVIIIGEKVTGNDNVGGIVGTANTSAQITDCINVGGSVEATGSNKGGIVGTALSAGGADTAFWYVGMENVDLSAIMNNEANRENIAKDEWGGIYGGNNTGKADGSTGRYFFYSESGGQLPAGTPADAYSGVTVDYGYGSDAERAQSLEYWLFVLRFGSPAQPSNQDITYNDVFEARSLYAYAYAGKSASNIDETGSYLRIVYMGDAGQGRSTMHERVDGDVNTVKQDGKTYINFNYSEGAHNIAVYYHTLEAVQAESAEYDGAQHEPEFDIPETGLVGQMGSNSEWTAQNPARASQYWYDLVLKDDGGADIPRERRFIDAGVYEGSLTVFLYDDDGYPKNVGSVPFRFEIIPIRILLTHDQQGGSDKSERSATYTGAANKTSIFIYRVKQGESGEVYSVGEVYAAENKGFLNNVLKDADGNVITEMEVWFDYVTDGGDAYSLLLPSAKSAVAEDANPMTSGINPETKSNKWPFKDYVTDPAKDPVVMTEHYLRDLRWMGNSGNIGMSGMKGKGYYQIRFEVKDVANGTYIEPKNYKYNNENYIQIGNYLVKNGLGGINAPAHTLGKASGSAAEEKSQPINAFTYFQVIQNNFKLSWEPTNSKPYDGAPITVKAKFVATHNFVATDDNDQVIADGDVTELIQKELEELKDQFTVSTTGGGEPTKLNGTLSIQTTADSQGGTYTFASGVGPDAGTYTVHLGKTETANCKILDVTATDGNEVAPKDGVFTITKRRVQLSFTTASRNYNGAFYFGSVEVIDRDKSEPFTSAQQTTSTNGAHYVTLTLVKGETLKVDIKYAKKNGATSEKAACNQGEYTLVVGDYTSKNYEVTAATTGAGTLTINPVSISLTWDPLEFVFNTKVQRPSIVTATRGSGGSNNVSQHQTSDAENLFYFTNSGNSNRESITFTVSATDSVDVGSYQISATAITVAGSNAAGATSNTDGNYNFSTKTQSYEIKPYVIQGTPQFGKVTKIYDGKTAYDGDVTITFNDPDFEGGQINLVKGSDFTVRSANFENKNVGTEKKVTYVLALTGQAAKNYDLSAAGDEGTYDNGTGDITPLELVVTLDRLLNNAAVKTYDGTATYGGAGATIKGNSQRSAIYRLGEGFTVAIASGQNVSLSETDAVTMTAVYKENDDRYSAFVNGIRPNTDVVAAKSLVFTLNGSDNYTFTVRKGTANGEELAKETSSTHSAEVLENGENLKIQIKQKVVRVTYENTRQSYANPDNTFNTDWLDVRANITNNGIVPSDRGKVGVQVVNGWQKQYEKYTVIRGSETSTTFGAKIVNLDTTEGAVDASINYKLANQPTLVIGYFIDNGDTYEIGSVASLIMATYYYTIAANKATLSSDMMEFLFGTTNTEVEIPVNGSNYGALLAENMQEAYATFLENGDEEDLADNYDNFISFLIEHGIDPIYETDDEGAQHTYFYRADKVAASEITFYNKFKLVADFDGIFTDRDIEILNSTFTTHSFEDDGSVGAPDWGVGKTYVNNFFVGKVGSALTAINGVFSSGVTVTDASPNEAFTGEFDGNGYVINTVKIVATEGNVGFFGEIGDTGVVKNLHLRNVDIAGTGTNIGGIAGSVAAGSGTDETTSISNVSVQGALNIDIATSAGMLFGSSARAISNAIAIGTINASGVTNVGGAIGTINASGVTNVGGAVGEATESASSVVSMTYVWATGATSVGGIVGDGSATDSTYLTNSVYNDKVAMTDGTSVSYDDLRKGSTTGYGTEKYYLSTAVKGKYDVLNDTELDKYAGDTTSAHQSLRFVDIVDTYLLKYAITANGTYESFTVYTQATVSYLVGEAKGTTDSRIKIGNVNGIALLSELRFAAFELMRDVKAPYKFGQYAGAFFGRVELNAHHIVFADWDETTELFEVGAPEGILAKA